MPTQHIEIDGFIFDEYLCPGKMKPLDFAVYCTIKKVTSPAGWGTISAARIATRLGLRGTKTVYRAVKKLLDLKLIERESKSKHHCNRYHVLTRAQLLCKLSLK